MTTLDELLVKLRQTGNRYDDGCMMHGELINPDGPAAADALEAAARENERLAGALAFYGRHKRGCSVFPRRTRYLPQCSCGFANALLGGPHE